MQKYFHPVETFMLENMDFFHEDYNTRVIQMIETCDQPIDQINSIIDKMALRFTKKASNLQAEKMFKGIGSNLLGRYDTRLESITK